MPATGSDAGRGGTLDSPRVTTPPGRWREPRVQDHLPRLSARVAYPPRGGAGLFVRRPIDPNVRWSLPTPLHAPGCAVERPAASRGKDQPAAGLTAASTWGEAAATGGAAPSGTGESEEAADGEPVSSRGAMPPDHGVTRNDDYGCRCEVCRAANADRHRELRARRRTSEPENDKRLDHGTRSTYVNHGCRCKPCAEAQRESNRRRPSRAQRGS